MKKIKSLKEELYGFTMVIISRKRKISFYCKNFQEKTGWMECLSNLVEINKDKPFNENNFLSTSSVHSAGIHPSQSNSSTSLFSPPNFLSDQQLENKYKDPKNLDVSSLLQDLNNLRIEKKEFANNFLLFQQQKEENEEIFQKKIEKEISMKEDSLKKCKIFSSKKKKIENI